MSMSIDVQACCRVFSVVGRMARRSNSFVVLERL